MSYEINEAKQLVIDAGLRLQKEGLIVRTWGNISARVNDKQFVITPSGRAYDTLTLDDIVLVNIKNCSYEGDIKPSSEVGVHADVFANRPEVNFVIHTHQTYASAMSILGKDIELTDEEKGFLGARIPCADYGMSSSPKLRKQVKKALKISKECKSMLLSNHGVLCMGETYENAFDISSMLEQVCKYQYSRLVNDERAKEVKEDNTELASEVEGASGVEVKQYDYGTSSISGEWIRLTIDEQECEYNINDKKPFGKGLKNRRNNQIAQLHAAIYSARRVERICHVTLPNIIDVSGTVKKGIEPYIDDYAQIVGVYTKCIGKAGKSKAVESVSALVKGLSENNAVMIAGQGALVVGSSEDDVAAAAFVLEKGCIAAKLALGQQGAKCVPKKIARLERDFYKNTYSKLK